jgi:putative membrane protein
MFQIQSYLILFVKGIAMGAADVIPGVSGGTIAFITGIYEELINSIKSVNLRTLKLLLTGKFAEFWKAINGTFLLSLVTGIAVSILTLAKGLKYLLDYYPILVWSFFFGLIVASAIYVARTIPKWNLPTVVSGIAGIIIAYFITVITPAEANITTWFIFLSGAIAICAMILPGISGSFILVLLGMYKFILEAVGNFNFAVIFTFIAGAAIGIISFSHVLSWLLKKHHNLTIALLSGFMVGSLNKVWPWKEAVHMTDASGELIINDGAPVVERYMVSLPEAFNTEVMLAMVIMIAGIATIWIIESLAKPNQKKD